jgi:hypothetical protein
VDTNGNVVFSDRGNDTVRASPAASSIPSQVPARVGSRAMAVRPPPPWSPIPPAWPWTRPGTLFRRFQ